MGKVWYFLFFYFPHFNFLVILFLVILFYFVSNSNKHFNVCSSEKILLLVVDVFWCSSSGDALAFAHFGSLSHGFISCHIGDNVSFKFGDVETKHTVSFCCRLYKILNFFKIFALLIFYFCLKFLHSAIERTPIRSIPDTGLCTSPHTLAQAHRPNFHTHTLA